LVESAQVAHVALEIPEREGERSARFVNFIINSFSFDRKTMKVCDSAKSDSRNRRDASQSDGGFMKGIEAEAQIAPKLIQL
jgi:hypothetical protein